MFFTCLINNLFRYHGRSVAAIIYILWAGKIQDAHLEINNISQTDAA